MNWPDRCTAVIPCWNEASSIGSLVTQVRAHLPEVVVVDDGSTDATALRAAASGAKVIRHANNLGKGAALRTGLGNVESLGREWALMLDGDGQHSPEEIPAFLNRAAATGASLVVGNRFGPVMIGAMPLLRRLVNRWMSRRLSIRAGQCLPDSQCGFRLVRISAWAALPLRTDHFEIESEMLLAFANAGLRIEFVPVAVIPSSRPSRVRALQDTVRWFCWWRQATRSRSSVVEPRVSCPATQ